MERNDILKDEQIEEITKALGEGKTEQSKLLERITSEHGDVDERSYKGIEENTTDNAYPYNVINKEVVQAEQYIEVDPRTGVETVVDAPVSNAKPLTEALDGEESVTAEAATETLKQFGLTDEDAMALYTLLSRVKSGEKFNVYHELPTAVQAIVRGINGPNMATMNATAREVLGHFGREMEADQAFVDLQESISKELNLLNFSNMYNDDLKNNMEVELPKKAAELEAAGEFEKAETLRNITAAFKDAYTLKPITDALATDELIRKRIKKDLTRYKRFVNDFNYKYDKSKFKIKDVRLLEKILPGVLARTSITVDDIKKFIIVFCKVTQKMSSENVVEHTFMYYTIQNMLLLQHLEVEVSPFAKEIYNNVVEAIELMKEVEKNECNSNRK